MTPLDSALVAQRNVNEKCYYDSLSVCYRDALRRRDEISRRATEISKGLRSTRVYETEVEISEDERPSRTKSYTFGEAKVSASVSQVIMEQ